jgi:branched-chain amino acid transport system ATP-binding protein
LLEVDGLTLAFGGVRALGGVGFAVQPGSITAVIGPNGAGKTSLFNTISGFYRPSAGRIRFRGQDITASAAPKRAALGLGRSFQNIALFRGMTVLDNIKLGRHAHLKTNVLDALFYMGRARREEAELRATSRNASSISWRSTTSATPAWRRCPTACKSASRWRGRWPCSRRF